MGLFKKKLIKHKVQNRNITPPLMESHKSGCTEIKFGICSDPHQDIMHDTEKRIKAFVDNEKEAQSDFIIHLGDFCRPYKKNLPFLKKWEEFKGPRFHTLGNHDNDGGFKWNQVLKFWNMPFQYYSFDMHGWHFVVLDGNEKKPKNRARGYPRYISKAQSQWLYEDLKKTPNSSVIFSHQSLEDIEGVENRDYIRSILENINKEAGWGKVCASFCGHNHVDFATQIEGIHYVQINSMSNYWIGGKYKHIRYSAEIDKKYPYIKYTVPFKDPLFAHVTLSPEGYIKISGTKSEFEGLSPWELGLNEVKDTIYDKERVIPTISDRHLKIDLLSQS
jgi:predicted phosphodiesterase